MAQQYSAAATLRLSVEGAAQARKELNETGAAASQMGKEVEAAAKKSSGFSLADTLKTRRAEINAAGGIAAGKSSATDVQALRGSLMGGGAKGNGDNSRFENVDTGFSAVQILAGSLGQRDIQEGAGLVADVANFIDTIPQLKKGIQDVAGVFTESGGAIGKLAGAGSGLLAPLGATAAGFGAVAAVLAPLVVVLGVAAASVKYYQNATETSSKALGKASEELKAYYGALETGTKESLKAEVEGLTLKKKLADEELKLRKEGVETAFRSEQKGFGGDAAARLKFALASLDGNFKSNQERVDELGKISVDLDSKIAALNRAMDSSQVAANSLKEKEKNLADQRAQAGQEQIAKEVQIQQAIKAGNTDAVKQRLADIEIQKAATQRELERALESGAGNDKGEKRIADLQAALDKLTDEAEQYTPEVLKQIKAQNDLNEATAEAQKAYEGARDALKSVSKEIADTENERSKTLKRRSEDDKIEAGRESIGKDYQARIKAANEADQLKQHTDRLGAIRKGADDRVTELTKAAILKDAEAVQADQKSRAALNKSYMADSLKSLKDYQAQEESADSQHKTARLRLLQDMYDSLYDAAANNDIAAFLQNKKAGDKNLERLDEDSSTEAEARKKAYLDQSTERDQKYADDLDALQTNYDEQKAVRDNGLQEQIAQVEAQEQQQIELENKQWDARITRAQQLQDEYAALQEQWRREDQERARRLEQEDYDAKLGALRDNQTEQLKILSASYQGQLDILSAFAENAKAALGGNLGAAENAANIGGNVLGQIAGALGIQLYADGGVATRPTLGILGEKPGWGDLVLPFPKSEGPRGALGGKSVTVDMRGAYLTGGATQADLDRIQAAVINGVASAWEDMAGDLGVNNGSA